MANPYHDETGRFCSKGEMQAAIQKLATKGDLDGYFALRKELEDIESGKIAVTPEFLAKALHNSYGHKINNREEAIAYAEAWKVTDSEDDPHYSSRAYNFISLIESEHTPDEVKEELFEQLDLETRKAVLTHGAMPGKDFETQQNLLKVIGDSDDPELIQKVVWSEALTYEDKYNLFSRYPAGLARLANHDPATTFSTPELVQEVTDKFHEYDAKSDHNSRITASAYRKLLAGHSEDPKTQREVLESTMRARGEGETRGVLSALMTNSKVDPGVALDTLKASREFNGEDFANYYETYTRYATKNHHIPPASFGTYRKLAMLKPGRAPQALVEAAEKSLNESQRVRAEGEVYAYKENMKELDAEYKSLYKKINKAKRSKLSHKAEDERRSHLLQSGLAGYTMSAADTLIERLEASFRN